MATEKKMPTTFEDASGRLDELVRQMESGQLALDKMIEAFEEGRRLVAYCNSKLTEVAKRVEQIKEDEKTGAIIREPFEK